MYHHITYNNKWDGRIAQTICFMNWSTKESVGYVYEDLWCLAAAPFAGIVPDRGRHIEMRAHYDTTTVLAHDTYPYL